jgi:hypothetical protein
MDPIYLNIALVFAWNVDAIEYFFTQPSNILDQLPFQDVHAGFNRYMMNFPLITTGFGNDNLGNSVDVYVTQLRL